jgi:hypothetical protein
LRGGVTWGFESRNIFCATLRNEYSTPGSAAVSDLDLTALGAFGHQQASFDEGRTTVFADAAMGRTYFYKLERAGRISVFWNKAKHVIVYERTVVPSRQFYLEQNPSGPTPPISYGIPILRKVREYVEILEEERRFPDDHLLTTTGASTGAATPDQRCGCIASCVFHKGAQINVSSSWGSDVNSVDAAGNPVSIGWGVPLWKRGARPANVYPFPKVSLSVFSEFGGKSKESPSDIGNPENVYFFTDTRPGTGSDTDKWVALLGIDAVDVPPVKAAASSSSAPSTLPLVGDVPVPVGFSPCTFQLLPPLRPANIVANRNSIPMAAVLNTVTMMRGYTPPSGAPNPVPTTAVSLLKAYNDGWENPLKAAGPGSWTQNTLENWATQVTAQIQPALAVAQTSAKTKWQAIIATSVDAYNKSALTRLRNQILTATVDGSSVVGGFQKVLQDVQAEIVRIKARPNVADSLTHLVQEQFGAIQQAVLDANATPGVLSALLQQYYVSATGIVSRAAQGLQLLRDAVNALPASMPSLAAQNAVASITKQVIALRQELAQVWQSAGLTRPIPELPDITQELIGGPLKLFSTQYDALLGRLNAAVASATTDFQQRIGELRMAILALPISFDQAVTDELGALAKVLRAGAVNADSSLQTYLDCFRSDLTQIVSGGNNWAKKNYDALIVAAQAADPDKVAKLFNDAYTSLTAQGGPLDTLNSTFQKEANTLAQFGQAFTDALNNFQAAAPKVLADLKSELTAALMNVEKSEEQLKRTLLEVRDAQLSAIHEYLDHGPDLHQ